MDKRTQEMLQRLTTLLIQHSPTGAAMPGYGGTQANDAESLRRISMTLHRWHELECGDSNDHASWCITRGSKVPNMEGGKRFEHDDDGKPYLEQHYHTRVCATTYHLVPDRERGAQKRLAKIVARYPTLTAYVQGDPRGAALYILKPGDVPEGASIDSCYSHGIAVFK